MELEDSEYVNHVAAMPKNIVKIQEGNCLFMCLQFLHPGFFLIAYGYYVEAYETDATLKS